MIRPFQLRDWGLLNRLDGNSVPLNASHILTNPVSPVYGAIAHRVLRRNFPTFIWQAPAGGPVAFVQLHLNQQRTQAHVLWVGTILDVSRRIPRSRKSAETWTHEAVWQSLFDELGVYLGTRGVQNLIAEAREDGAESGILRNIGFANYARQDILKLEQWQPSDNSIAKLLTPRHPSDAWHIELLYAHTVPQAIRSIEPHPTISTDSWVYHEKNELVAFANHKASRSADWLQLMIRLETKADPVQLVRDAIIFKPPSKDHPLYCNVRQYQTWLRTALESNGFHQIGSQLMLVRHTVQPKKHKVINRLDDVLKAHNGAIKTAPYGNTQFTKEGAGLQE